MFDLVSNTAGGLDQIRARLLEQTLSRPFVREAFRTRWKRALFVLAISFPVQLVLAVHFPIPMLILGPLIFGAPHLIASFRHGFSQNPQSIFEHERPRLALSSLVWFGVALYRLLERGTFNFWAEILGLCALALIWLPVVKNRALTLSALGVLAVATAMSPFGTFAFLIFFHHFVAFFHWVRNSRTRAEKNASLLALGIFSAIHVLIFAGFFDSWIGGAEWKGIPTRLLESTFKVWTDDPLMIMRCLVAYAFGQSLHYSLWLKIIPDQQHPAQMATSFKQSWRLFQRDFKITGTWIAGFSIFLMLGFGIFKTGIEFRWIYFCIASFHGFYEIFGLCFTPRRASA